VINVNEFVVALLIFGFVFGVAWVTKPFWDGIRTNTSKHNKRNKK
jgi:ABC-type transport system involved in cytochrome c biogenesis permease subunit